jgi:serine kinase of HPr protein (carbohydrate metabolism regulator)
VKQVRLYATAIAIGNHAVLLMGPSGSGKSDLALRLVDRGACLISDDYTILEVQDGALLASAPDTIAGKIEVRGIGIVAIPHIDNVAAALVVHLGGPVERMPLRRTMMTIAGVDLPEIKLEAFEQSAPIKVELALHRATKDL